MNIPTVVKGLNENQKMKLRNRRKMAPQTRANFDYKMAIKLRSKLDGLSGLLSIIKALPPKKLREGEYIEDEHVRTLLELTQSALKILNYKKVRGTADDLYILEEKNKKIVGINGTTGEAIRRGEFHKASAKKKDIERAILLHDHVGYLIQKFVPEINIEHPGSGQSYSMEDLIDMQMMKKEEQKIKELLASAMTDNCSSNLVKIEQIAKEANCDPLEVLHIAYQIQETKREIERSAERRKQDILNLESNSAAIQTIKELWAKGYFNYTAIAVEIAYNKSIVITVIEKMMTEGQISEGPMLVPGNEIKEPEKKVSGPSGFEQ
jgi:hypothetical protein